MMFVRCGLFLGDEAVVWSVCCVCEVHVGHGWNARGEVLRV